MYLSWCYFPHESHCLVFQIRCFQGNGGPYNICHFRPFGRQNFSEGNYLKSPRGDTVVLQSKRWVDFYNKPHYSYFKLCDLRMILVPAPSVCLHVVLCVQTKVIPHMWKTVKCASVQDSFCITDLSEWNRGRCDLSARHCLERSHWWQAWTTASQSDWQLNHPRYKKTDRGRLRTDPFLILYLRKEHSFSILWHLSL